MSNGSSPNAGPASPDQIRPDQVRPDQVRPDQIRNVVLVGPPGAGKTVLFERLVAARSDGPAPRSDPRPSQSLRAATVASDGLIVNLLDAPGNPDFVGEVRAGLRAADAVLFVVPASGDIDEATRMLWRECETIGRPRAIAVTKLEAARGDFDETLHRCRRTFGDAQPVEIPLTDGGVTGSLNLLRGTASDYVDGRRVSREPTAAEQALIEDRRGELIESVIEESEDEDLLERHLSGEQIDVETLARDLRTAVATARFFPVLATHAPANVGVDALYELFAQGFPAPTAASLPTVQTCDGKPYGAITCDPAGPLVAEVVRTSSDPFVGRLSLVRVFSGTLRLDTPLHVSGHLRRFAPHQDGHPDHDTDDERVGPLLAPLGDETRPKPYAIAGELVLVTKLQAAETSDTLSDKERPALVEPWVLPEPLLPVAVHATTRGDEEKLTSALARLVAEDVTMRLERNPETHQIVLWTLGPAHLDRLLASLADTWHVRVEVEPLRTSLRETFLQPTESLGRLVKQSGGHGQYAICRLQIEPLNRGSGIEFAERVVGGAVPKQFIGSVEKGVRTQLAKGILAGYPVVDVRVTLLDGKAHSVDSSDAAFQTAGALALREAANATTMSLLEPIDELAVTVSDEFVGAVLADLRGRRGQVHGTETAEQPGHTVIRAEVPAGELSRYPIDLRSVARGTGSFTRRFVRYDYLPPALARGALTG